MKIRQHRGGLPESLATTETIEPTREAIAYWANVNHPGMFAAPEQVATVYQGIDWRIDSEVWLVTIAGRAVGFCDCGVMPPLPAGSSPMSDSDLAPLGKP